MRTLTLSGWGQPTDALQPLAANATPIDYARFAHARAALASMGVYAGTELVIGWSLGGQMAVRAIASGLLKPKKLVLIATPFQFVARPSHKLGMPANLFTLFRDNYEADPERTLAKAWASIMKGDEKAAQVRAHLEQQDKAALLSKDWLNWLDILHHFSCHDLFLADFPPTLLIHGDKDAVVYHEQSVAFEHAIPHAELLTIKNCGHAPHWHDPALIQKVIGKFAHV